MLDAWGWNATEIGKALDCTPDYVRKSRREEWFADERAKWIGTGMVVVDEVLSALKVRALGVHAEALDGLQEAMVASDDEGRPLWDVRIKAYQIALNHRLIQAIVGAVDEGKSITAAVTQVTVNFMRGEDGLPILDYVEGEIVDDPTA